MAIPLFLFVNTMKRMQHYKNICTTGMELHLVSWLLLTLHSMSPKTIQTKNCVRVVFHTFDTLPLSNFDDNSATVGLEGELVIGLFWNFTEGGVSGVDGQESDILISFCFIGSCLTFNCKFFEFFLIFLGWPDFNTELLEDVGGPCLANILLLGSGFSILILLEMLLLAGICDCGILLDLLVLLFINISFLLYMGTFPDDDDDGCNKFSTIKITPLFFWCPLLKPEEMPIFCVSFSGCNVFITSELVVDIKPVFVISNLIWTASLDALTLLLWSVPWWGSWVVCRVQMFPTPKFSLLSFWMENLPKQPDTELRKREVTYDGGWTVGAERLLLFFHQYLTLRRV